MKIGIFSDIHDSLSNLSAVLARLQDCDELICCGDLCSPFVARKIGEATAVPVHIVFGNNDGDRYRIREVSRSFQHLQFYGEYVELERDGCLISVNHFDNIGRAIAKAPGYDLVCFGHNHTAELTRKASNDGWVLNPGEVLGALSGTVSFAVYDTVGRQPEIIRLD